MRMALANALTRSPGEGPSFSLDLLRDTLDSRLSFSRASGATDMVGGTLISYPTDIPRISAASGLLIEEPRTNLAFGNSFAANTGMSGTGSQSDPLGGNAALLLTEDTASSAHNAATNSMALTAGQLYSISLFVKAGSCNRVQLLAQSNISAATVYANYFLSGAGSVSASGAGASNSFITALEGGWYRIGLTFTASASASGQFYVATLVTGSETRAPTFTGTSRTVTAWGPQLEQGAFTSSYISTTTVAATRAADLCSITPGSWLNLNEGTLWMEATSGGIDTGAVNAPRLWRLRDTNADNYHEVRRHPADRTLRGGTNTATVSQSNLTAEMWSDATTAHSAYAWRHNDMALCFAGNTAQADTSSPGGMASGLNLLRLGASANNAGFWNGYLRRLRCWTRRLNNDQLKAITQ